MGGTLHCHFIVVNKEYSKERSKLLFFFNPFCLPCSAASNLFRIDNKLFNQKILRRG